MTYVLLFVILYEVSHPVFVSCFRIIKTCWQSVPGKEKVLIRQSLNSLYYTPSYQRFDILSLSKHLNYDW